jgi:hypothetical protein
VVLDAHGVWCVACVDDELVAVPFLQKIDVTSWVLTMHPGTSNHDPLSHNTRRRRAFTFPQGNRCTVLVFEHKLALEDAIKSHDCSLSSSSEQACDQ